MIGSIAGDIIGAPYEFNNIKTVDFDIFNKQTSFTDDTVMLLANAKWLLDSVRNPDRYSMANIDIKEILSNVITNIMMIIMRIIMKIGEKILGMP